MPMDTDILVSICVVTYNSQLYVEETLESVGKQTYPNIELIISDDHSTDETISICKEWIQKNGSRFVRTLLIQSEKNTGIAANCNRAHFAANGEWLKLIAGDDVLLSDCIEKNVNYVQKNADIQLLQSYNLYIDSESHLLEIPLYRKDSYFFNSSAELQHAILLRKYVANTVSTFMKRSLFVAIGGFDEEISMLEDYPFWLLCTDLGVKIYFMDELTTYYRVHQTSISNGGEKGQAQILPPIIDYNLLVKEKYVIPYLKGIEKYVAENTIKLTGKFARSKFNRKCCLCKLIWKMILMPQLIVNRIVLSRLYKCT